MPRSALIAALIMGKPAAGRITPLDKLLSLSSQWLESKGVITGFAQELPWDPPSGIALILGAFCLGCSPGSCSQLPPSKADSSSLCHFPMRPEEGLGRTGFANRCLRISKHHLVEQTHHLIASASCSSSQGSRLWVLCSGSVSFSSVRVYMCVFMHLHVCGVGYFWVSESLHVASSVPGLHSHSISHIHDVQLFVKYYQGCDE